jgi:hypothetical protein
VTMYRFQNSVNSAQGPALDGVEIYVCSQPAVTSTIPPSPLITLYTDSTGGTTLANPVVTDGLGNFFFYAPTGVYTIVYFDPIGRIPTTVFPDQQVVTQGGGSVSSIALTMPAEFSVSGSPVTSSGTFAVTKANESANTVYAGPATGAAAAPTFRALVAADITGLAGSVSSVTLAVSAGTLFTASVTGTNPITTTGTFTLNLNFANMSANTFIAGPSSGSAAAPTARLITAADLPALNAMSFSATPTFNAGVYDSFSMTLTGNVISSTISNPTAGQTITFILTQDATGGRTFTYASNVRGWSNVDTNANAVTVQSFIWDGTNWRATGPGSTNAS